jgi:hypothetical protein
MLLWRPKAILLIFKSYNPINPNRNVTFFCPLITQIFYIQICVNMRNMWTFCQSLMQFEKLNPNRVILKMKIQSDAESLVGSSENIRTSCFR